MSVKNFQLSKHKWFHKLCAKIHQQSAKTLVVGLELEKNPKVPTLWDKSRLSNKGRLHQPEANFYHLEGPEAKTVPKANKA